MSLTDAELAAVGRLLGFSSLSLRIVGDEVVYYDSAGHPQVGDPIQYFAADVLTKLAAEGARPYLNWRRNGQIDCLVGDDGEPIRALEDTWPLAILRCAAAYQIAKESA